MSNPIALGIAVVLAARERVNYIDCFIRDVYSVQTGPKQIEFGHVFEDPDMWEQRYERKDHDKKRFQGKV